MRDVAEAGPPVNRPRRAPARAGTGTAAAAGDTGAFAGSPRAVAPLLRLASGHADCSAWSALARSPGDAVGYGQRQDEVGELARAAMIFQAGLGESEARIAAEAERIK